MLSGVQAAAARLTCPGTIRQWGIQKRTNGQGAKIQSGIETVILLASDDKRREVPIIP
jgi:hypothetical protein